MGKKILVASAWPYANGPLHLGHVAALLPADVIARYHRACGDDVLFVSGSDCHGTPIEVAAEGAGVAPGDIAATYHAEFVDQFSQLGFSYSRYSLTMGDGHARRASELFTRLYQLGLLVLRTEEHLYCPSCDRFLPDRYVEGRCHHCGATGARGDQCDSCGKLTDALLLVEPRCRTCGSSPIRRESTHLYFKLSEAAAVLRPWLDRVAATWRPNATAATESWLRDGLRDRAVTRDLSWGIPVPLPGFDGKRIYVWFEAVMGYLTCSMEWAEGRGDPERWREWWLNGSATHYYVHGKDNIPFHTVIWPAMLAALGLHLPDQIVSSEYLTFGGGKLSKSRGSAVTLGEALARYDADAIRFYLMRRGPESSDTAFSWDDFKQVVNGDLLGKLGNLWQRTFSFAYQNWGCVPARPSSIPGDLLQRTEQAFAEVGQAIEGGRFRAALELTLALADQANAFLSEQRPWRTVATDRDRAAAATWVACQVAGNLHRLVAPFTPRLAERIGTYLQDGNAKWEFIQLCDGLALAEPHPAVAKVESVPDGSA